jgi:alpha-glucosidase
MNYLDSIHHSGSSRYVFPNLPDFGEEVTLRLRTAVTPDIQQVILRTCPDGEQQFTPLKPETPHPSGIFRWWRATMQISMPITTYRFLIISAEGTYWYNASGLHAFNPTDVHDFRLLAGFQAPGWLKTAVFYQIFPDRFADGDASSNVQDDEYEYFGYKAKFRQWGEPPTTGSRAAMVEFYGGDLAGIISHLDYLEDLGVNALYLNPIFTALSNHRYDVIDYYSVDPHLGGNQALISLRQALDERHMHYILDIVPNHCGIMHPWFQAALKDINAPTAEYFIFNNHPDDFATWLGVRSLVKLNYRSAALRKVIYQGENSVFRHWLRPPYSADGWRIDVANMLARQGADQLGIEVGRGVRQAVKAENPQAYLMGENFFDASSQLQGDCWDGVMNYSGFALPLKDWLDPIRIYVPGQRQWINTANQLTTQALVDGWGAFRATIPWAIATQQFNLIGSHDTPRALALLNGNRDLYHLIVTLMFTYPGVPSVFYGDEIGLGDQGPEPRQCMRWDQSTWDWEMLSFYKKLIHLRRNSPALADGGFQILLVEDDTLIYQRDSDEEIILVIARRGKDPRRPKPIPVWHGAVRDGIEFSELFSGQRSQVKDGMLAMPEIYPGGQIWIAQNF